MLYFQNAILKQNFMQILAKECKKKIIYPAIKMAQP